MSVMSFSDLERFEVFMLVLYFLCLSFSLFLNPFNRDGEGTGIA